MQTFFAAFCMENVPKMVPCIPETKCISFCDMKSVNGIHTVVVLVNLFQILILIRSVHTLQQFVKLQIIYSST